MGSEMCIRDSLKVEFQTRLPRSGVDCREIILKVKCQTRLPRSGADGRETYKHDACLARASAKEKTSPESQASDACRHLGEHKPGRGHGIAPAGHVIEARLTRRSCHSLLLRLQVSSQGVGRALRHFRTIVTSLGRRQSKQSNTSLPASWGFCNIDKPRMKL